MKARVLKLISLSREFVDINKIKSVIFSCLNSMLVSSVATKIKKKIVKKFMFNFHFNFTSPMSRENNFFLFPGLIFSRTLSLFKQELPKHARFPRQLRLSRVQNTKKIPKSIIMN